MTCDNFETYYIPRGYDYREVSTKCGNTKTDGSRAICDSCRNDKRRMAQIDRQEANIEADNAWARSAGWGEY